MFASNASVLLPGIACCYLVTQHWHREVNRATLPAARHTETHKQRLRWQGVCPCTGVWWQICFDLFGQSCVHLTLTLFVSNSHTWGPGWQVSSALLHVYLWAASRLTQFCGVMLAQRLQYRCHISCHLAALCVTHWCRQTGRAAEQSIKPRMHFFAGRGGSMRFEPQLQMHPTCDYPHVCLGWSCGVYFLMQLLLLFYVSADYCLRLWVENGKKVVRVSESHLFSPFIHLFWQSVPEYSHNCVILPLKATVILIRPYSLVCMVVNTHAANSFRKTLLCQTARWLYMCTHPHMHLNLASALVPS